MATTSSLRQRPTSSNALWSSPPLSQHSSLRREKQRRVTAETSGASTRSRLDGKQLLREQRDYYLQQLDPFEYVALAIRMDETTYQDEAILKVPLESGKLFYNQQDHYVHQHQPLTQSADQTALDGPAIGIDHPPENTSRQRGSVTHSPAVHDPLRTFVQALEYIHQTTQVGSTQHHSTLEPLLNPSSVQSGNFSWWKTVRSVFSPRFAPATDETLNSDGAPPVNPFSVQENRLPLTPTVLSGLLAVIRDEVDLMQEDSSGPDEKARFPEGLGADAEERTLMAARAPPDELDEELIHTKNDDVGLDSVPSSTANRDAKSEDKASNQRVAGSHKGKRNRQQQHSQGRRAGTAKSSSQTPTTASLGSNRELSSELVAYCRIMRTAAIQRLKMRRRRHQIQRIFLPAMALLFGVVWYHHTCTELQRILWQLRFSASLAAAPWSQNVIHLSATPIDVAARRWSESILWNRYRNYLLNLLSVRQFCYPGHDSCDHTMLRDRVLEAPFTLHSTLRREPITSEEYAIKASSNGAKNGVELAYEQQQQLSNRDPWSPDRRLPSAGNLQWLGDSTVNGIVQEQIDSFLSPKMDRRILDVGCGIGGTLYALYPGGTARDTTGSTGTSSNRTKNVQYDFFMYHGVSVSDAEIHFAHRLAHFYGLNARGRETSPFNQQPVHTQISFERGNFDDIPRRNAKVKSSKSQFTAVVAIESLAAWSSNLTATVLSLLELLRPGGILVVVDYVNVTISTNSDQFCYSTMSCHSSFYANTNATIAKESFQRYLDYPTARDWISVWNAVNRSSSSRQKNHPSFLLKKQQDLSLEYDVTVHGSNEVAMSIANPWKTVATLTDATGGPRGKPSNAGSRRLGLPKVDLFWDILPYSWVGYQYFVSFLISPDWWVSTISRVYLRAQSLLVTEGSATPPKEREPTTSQTALTIPPVLQRVMQLLEDRHVVASGIQQQTVAFDHADLGYYLYVVQRRKE
jgi:SAM-dependent methyltransferase